MQKFLPRRGDVSIVSLPGRQSKIVLSRLLKDQRSHPCYFSRLFSINILTRKPFFFVQSTDARRKEKNFQVIAGFILVLLLQIMCKDS